MVLAPTLYLLGISASLSFELAALYLLGIAASITTFTWYWINNEVVRIIYPEEKKTSEIDIDMDFCLCNEE